jgi:Ala-tRNA(Pro) deacylase
MDGLLEVSTRVAELEASLAAETARGAALRDAVGAMEYRCNFLARALGVEAAAPAPAAPAAASPAVAAAACAAPAAAVPADLSFRLGAGVLRSSSDAARMAHCVALLDRLGIVHDTQPHGAAKTMEEVLAALCARSGVPCKNLVCKAKKTSRTRARDTKMWLIVAAHDTDVKLKALSKALGYKDAMRFAKSDLLLELLQAQQGEVSPFHLVNDPTLRVQVVLDAALFRETPTNKSAAAPPLFFHPLCCTASSAIAPNDLLAFVRAAGREPLVVDFAAL